MDLPPPSITAQRPEVREQPTSFYQALQFQTFLHHNFISYSLDSGISGSRIPGLQTVSSTMYESSDTHYPRSDGTISLLDDSDFNLELVEPNLDRRPRLDTYIRFLQDIGGPDGTAELQDLPKIQEALSYISSNYPQLTIGRVILAVDRVGNYYLGYTNSALSSLDEIMFVSLGPLKLESDAILMVLL